MTAHVLDSSAILIVLKGEPGKETIVPLLPGAFVCAVNAAECIAVLVRDGVAPDIACAGLESSQVQIVNFDEALAISTGLLIARTKHLGLSLGDRACLALAMRQGAPAYTADQRWKDLSIGVEIRMVR